MTSRTTYNGKNLDRTIPYTRACYDEKTDTDYRPLPGEAEMEEVILSPQKVEITEEAFFTDCQDYLISDDPKASEVLYRNCAEALDDINTTETLRTLNKHTELRWQVMTTTSLARIGACLVAELLKNGVSVEYDSKTNKNRLMMEAK